MVQGQRARRGARLMLWSAAVAAVSSPATRAAQWTWTGGSAVDSNWATPENWSPLGPPASAPSTDLVFSGNNRTTSTHGAFTLNTLTFPAGGSGFEILSTGPLTFAADDTQPAIRNNQGFPTLAAIRGDIVIPAGVTLDTGTASVIHLGNPVSAAGGSRIGGAGARGGTLIAPNGNGLVILDNSRTTAGARAVELDKIVSPQGTTFAVGNSSFTGPGVSFDVPTIELPSTGVGIAFNFDQAGADGNRFGFGSTTITGGSFNNFITGDRRSSGARTGMAAPRVTVEGTLAIPGGSLAAAGNILLDRAGDAPTVVYDTGIRSGSTGTIWFGSHDPDTTHTLQFGSDASDRIDIGGGSLVSRAVFDNTLGATGQVSSKRLVVKSDITIGEGGSVDIRNSATITSGGGMEFEGSFIVDSTGTAPVTLFLNVGGGPGGVTFGPNTRIRRPVPTVPNGRRFRVEGLAANLANLLTPARIASADVDLLVVAPTDAPFDLGGNLPATTTLAVVNSNPNGIDVRLNAAGGTTTTSEMRVSPGATLDAANNILNGQIRGTGTILGPVTLGGTVTPGTVDPAVPTAGTLNTGALTLADAAEVQLILGEVIGRTTLHASGNVLLDPGAPGPRSGPELELFFGSGFGARHAGERFTILAVDAGFSLTGVFEGMPDGFFIPETFRSTVGFVINYNVDGGDGSANDVVLTAVPEPGTLAPLAAPLALVLRPRRARRGRRVPPGTHRD